MRHTSNSKFIYRILGEWSAEGREWLLKKNALHVLASDAHDPKRRTPILSKGRDIVAAMAGDDVANLLVSENPEAIMRGESLT